MSKYQVGLIALLIACVAFLGMDSCQDLMTPTDPGMGMTNDDDDDGMGMGMTNDDDDDDMGMGMANDDDDDDMGMGMGDDDDDDDGQ